jgi:SAM-dependent methyltransferase
MDNTSSPSILGKTRHKLRISLDRVIDRLWRIDTLVETWKLSENTGKFTDATQNVPINYYLLFRFVGQHDFKSDDVFYDVGCGSGRVLCYVARKRISKVVGIELSPAFATRAKANCANLKSRNSPIEIRCGDAAEMDYSDGTVFFLYNPFGPKTLESVLDNIRITCDTNDRTIYFLYHNPVYASVFKSANWLEYAGKKTDIFCKQEMGIWKYDHLQSARR